MPTSLNAAGTGMDHCRYGALNGVLFYLEPRAGPREPERRGGQCVQELRGWGCSPGSRGAWWPGKGRSPVGSSLGRAAELRGCPAERGGSAVPQPVRAAGQRAGFGRLRGDGAQQKGAGEEREQTPGGKRRAELPAGQPSRPALLRSAELPPGHAAHRCWPGLALLRAAEPTAALPCLRLPGRRAGGAAPTRRFPAREVLIHQL